MKNRVWKRVVGLLVFVLLLSQAPFAQDLSGVWRGQFYNLRDIMIYGDAAKYRYEIQLVATDNAISGMKGTQGVTFSYQDKRFYGKANCMGIYAPDTKTLTLMEDKMLELKIEGGGSGCLMTCYLEYKKEYGTEILEGTYTSQNMNDSKENCGGGKVRLEKVPDSEFGKEDFLVLHEARKGKPSTNQKATVKPGQEDFLVKKTPTTPASPKPPAQKPAQNTPNKTVSPPTAKPETSKPPTTTKDDQPPTAKQPNREADKPAPKPDLPKTVKERQNELYDVITTSASEITVSLYDNGEVDGDIISVYHNNKLLASGKMLSAKPQVYTINLSEENPDHELLVVAENLGSIPPNTALVIIQAGTERYTLRIASSNEKNAAIRFRYKP